MPSIKDSSMVDAIAIVVLAAMLLVCGCGYSGKLPDSQYQSIELYTPEHRIENLERNARELSIRSQLRR